MKDFEDIDDLTLLAYVDGELDLEQRERVVKAMETDSTVRERVYKLRHTKDLMNLGFSHAEPPTATNEHPKSTQGWSWISLAASLVIISASFGFGYWSHLFLSKDDTAQLAAQAEPVRIVLHISHSNPKHFRAVFAYIEDFIREHDGREDQIEIVANAQGLDLIREDISPYREQVNTLIRNHPNVHFIACANAIRELAIKGVTPRFNPSIPTHRPAFDHLLERVQQGWTYIKVDGLVET